MFMEYDMIDVECVCRGQYLSSIIQVCLSARAAAERWVFLNGFRLVFHCMSCTSLTWQRHVLRGRQFMRTWEWEAAFRSISAQDATNRTKHANKLQKVCKKSANNVKDLFTSAGLACVGLLRSLYEVLGLWAAPRYVGRNRIHLRGITEGFARGNKRPEVSMSHVWHAWRAVWYKNNVIVQEKLNM